MPQITIVKSKTNYNYDVYNCDGAYRQVIEHSIPENAWTTVTFKQLNTLVAYVSDFNYKHKDQFLSIVEMTSNPENALEEDTFTIENILKEAAAYAATAQEREAKKQATTAKRKATLEFKKKERLAKKLEKTKAELERLSNDN